jgi:hypothetical protein
MAVLVDTRLSVEAGMNSSLVVDLLMSKEGYPKVMVHWQSCRPGCDVRVCEQRTIWLPRRYLYSQPLGRPRSDQVDEPGTGVTGRSETGILAYESRVCLKRLLVGMCASSDVGEPRKGWQFLPT